MNDAPAVRVYLSLGSNINPRQHLKAALDALHETFGDMTLSRVYESQAVGFSGDNFYNLVVGLECALSVGQLLKCLRAIEDDNARDRSGPKFSARTLDIDILTYGDLVGEIDGIALPRDEILKYAFVLIPLADIASDERHPVLRETYGNLVKKMDIRRQPLWPVAFPWGS